MTPAHAGMTNDRLVIEAQRSHSSFVICASQTRRAARVDGRGHDRLLRGSAAGPAAHHALEDQGIGNLQQAAASKTAGKPKSASGQTLPLKLPARGTLFLFDEPTTGLHFDDIAKLMRALRDEPDQDLLARRLASEVALSSVLEKALLLQRTLLTGKKEPNVAANQLAVEAVNHESDTLDQEIRNLKTELELRRELANNSPMAIIQRHGTRAAGSRGIYEGDPVPDRLDRLQRGNPGGTP